MLQLLLQLIKDWKSLIAANKFAELFRELNLHLNERSTAFNQFINLQRRYNSLRTQEEKGTISAENAVLQHNQVSDAFIAAIDALQTSDLNRNGEAADRPTRTVAEEHAWEFTADTDTHAAYKKFLDRFPDGFYAPNAQARLAYFDADDTAWEFANDNGSEKALQKYLDKYPEGLHAEEARQKIAALKIAERRRINPFYDLMIPIKGGTFDMGDTFGDGFDREKPVHKVRLSDYWLCKYPVTQGLWKAIMGEDNNPSGFKGDDMLPVETVSWDDAQAFIEALNKKTGGQYRLPTEAEWEYAARAAPSPAGEGRGGAKIRFGNGKDIANSAEMNFNARKDYKEPYSIVGEYREKTTPVNRFKPNALGLYDMAGNVWNWCADWFEEDYYQQCQAQGTVSNPQGPDTGVYRVIRGGGWGYYPQGCRAACRYGHGPGYRGVNLGFRLVLQGGG